MDEIDRLGFFYLGKVLNVKGELTNEPLYYPSKDLTTHAVCVGMTGSGKTGLGIVLLEEAALDGIPAIIIDPKGDLADLLLTFPRLSAEDFLPWIDPVEASSKGLEPEAYAKSLADKWKKNLAEWGEQPSRIQKMKDSVDMVIYTPASMAGVPLSILDSFAPPPKEILLDSAALRERIQTMASSLLGLVGIDADPIKSREHILISTLIDAAWQKNTSIGLAELIQQIQKPPFNKIGVLDLETFFPAKDRIALSVSLNNLLASPGFQAWMAGEPLNIQDMLYTDKGKPKLSIISIAHLTDAERMFIVTLLLNELLGWMRRQSGTSSLRAILYMDEIFGYFPPTANPPSKTPMLTLLKQARAFGLGCVLCTQNPVDLDYKGLANCGTWFVGKLQTERDKERLIEGLQVGGKAEFNRLLNMTGAQKFLFNSIHENEPLLFQTRWAMSYLKGPLTLVQIAQLAENMHKPPPQEKSEAPGSSRKPILPPSVPEYFIKVETLKPPVIYKPFVVGMSKLHYTQAKYKINEWQEVCIVAPFSDDGKEVVWSKGENLPEIIHYFSDEPLPGSTYGDLPAEFGQDKAMGKTEKAFVNYLYQEWTISLYEISDIPLISKPGEKEADFRSRATLLLREKRDAAIEAIKKKYADKIATMTERVRRAEVALEKQQAQASEQKRNTFLAMLMAFIKALFGRKITKGTITETETSLRRAGRIGRESQDVAAAEENLKGYQQQLQALEDELAVETAKITAQPVTDLALQTVSIAAKKGDIAVHKIALVWRPYSVS